MKKLNRREFARTCAGLTAVALTTPALLVQAADMPHVDPESAQAKALGYTHDATTVDTGKYANFVAGSHCANCQLYQGGDEWGGCGIFPGQQVAAGGWCSAYAKKAG
ncbi:MAG: high-potential iron-sulfur protein [Gammaproteobacteria bacterium]|nr:high-potential iron-sulfur protein [Gammaproteobacteria bacterium]MCP5202324.1 high-potential iron-sulfur protein [Gammaproteobacteria bacterium]